MTRPLRGAITRRKRVPFVDVVNVIAVLFGVWNSVRKLNVAKVQHDDYPHVSAADFQAWQRKELRAYNLAVWACFLQVILDLGWKLYATQTGFIQAQPKVSAGISFVIFASWFIALITATLLGTSGRALRGELGIVVGNKNPRVAQDDDR